VCAGRGVQAERQRGEAAPRAVAGERAAGVPHPPSFPAPLPSCCCRTRARAYPGPSWVRPWTVHIFSIAPPLVCLCTHSVRVLCRVCASRAARVSQHAHSHSELQYVRAPPAALALAPKPPGARGRRVVSFCLHIRAGESEPTTTTHVTHIHIRIINPICRIGGDSGSSL